MGSCSSKKQPQVAPEHRVFNLFADKTVLTFPELETYYSAAHPFLSAKLKPLFQEVLAKEAEETASISLNFAVIGENQAVHLSRIIGFYPQLRTLKLWKTRLGPAGMKKLAFGLSQLSTLEYLGLEDNALKDEGATYLTEGLAPLTKLKEIYLQINSVGDVGVSSLSKSLSNKPSLHVLNLSENLLESLGLGTLLMSISASIKILDLAHNRLGPQGAEVLIAAWSGLPLLEKVSVGGNGLGDDAERRLVGMSTRVQVLL